MKCIIILEIPIKASVYSYTSVAQIPQCTNPTTCHFVTENLHRCAHFYYKTVHFGRLTNALWDLRDEFIEMCLGVQWAITPSIIFIMMTSSNGNIFRATGHLCGEFTGPGEFPAQRPVTPSFDVFLDLRLNKRSSKQSWGWWFETLSRPLRRHSNDHSPLPDDVFAPWPEIHTLHTSR